LRYKSRIDALLALATIQRQDSSRRESEEKRAYRCKRCYGWHLTSRAVWLPEPPPKVPSPGVQRPV
jgi:hypothetical protein